MRLVHKESFALSTDPLDVAGGVVRRKQKVDRYLNSPGFTAEIAQPFRAGYLRFSGLWHWWQQWGQGGDVLFNEFCQGVNLQELGQVPENLQRPTLCLGVGNIRRVQVPSPSSTHPAKHELDRDLTEWNRYAFRIVFGQFSLVPFGKVPDQGRVDWAEHVPVVPLVSAGNLVLFACEPNFDRWSFLEPRVRQR